MIIMSLATVSATRQQISRVFVCVLPTGCDYSADAEDDNIVAASSSIN